MLDNSREVSEGENSIWKLADEWRGRIERSYEEYRDTSSRLGTTLLLSSFGVFLLLSGVFLIQSQQRNLSDTSIFKSDMFFSAYLIFAALAAGILVWMVGRRFQQLQLLKGELADLSDIANQLLQMVISTEEHSTTSGRYEALVNHVRVLEIKHLLKKVELIVGRSTSPRY